MPEKDYIIACRVYIEDTDLMGIVYHARYLYFFERARTEVLRHHGITLTTLAKENLHFAIREVHISYHHPARLDDWLTIKTILKEQKACTLEFKQTMVNQDKQLICEASVKVVTVDQNLKPKRCPKSLLGGG
jgi:acyl-CoA thioester hydrolase